MATIAIMVAGAILNATAFVGGSYLARTFDRKHMDQERIRHDKALEAYQKAMGEYEKKRQQYQDWLSARYANKKIAEEDLENTDYAFKLYSQTHPHLGRKPVLRDYYEPNEKQKEYEMAYVGIGTLLAGVVAYNL